MPVSAFTDSKPTRVLRTEGPDRDAGGRPRRRPAPAGVAAAAVRHPDRDGGRHPGRDGGAHHHRDTDGRVDRDSSRPFDRDSGRLGRAEVAGAGMAGAGMAGAGVAGSRSGADPDAPGDRGTGRSPVA
ncbi:hypothetical protein [Saccharothrix australiensis]|uniref:Uncharacterized protein n=1 Tax=Saccharothrix australiensis TaxID=2072 RepID=A0A495W3X4_9PSEU|nr:hypothetical protein [Saccharothrix australiensis]RKT55465.1 hypothetical protein C8E97_4134 [Saccharothrix australiensis]